MKMGLHERFEPTPTERKQFAEAKRFRKILVDVPRRERWALVTGWDKLTDKPAVWKDGKLEP